MNWLCWKIEAIVQKIELLKQLILWKFAMRSDKGSLIVNPTDFQSLFKSTFIKNAWLALQPGRESRQLIKN